MSSAIGMLETYGLLPAVEGLDAALKSANVKTRSFEYVGGGLVAWFVEGEVGAVRVAVAAGKAAASRLGTVISDHVIPRPAGDVADLLPRPDPSAKGKAAAPARLEAAKVAGALAPAKEEAVEEAAVVEAASADEPAPAPPEEAPADEAATEAAEEVVVIEQEPAVEAAVAEPTNGAEGELLYTQQELEGLSVVRLRAIARHTEGILLTRAQIRDAIKSTLVNAILEAQDDNGEVKRNG
jgi:microcompartment protein CcmL/EutN